MGSQRHFLPFDYTLDVVERGRTTIGCVEIGDFVAVDIPTSDKSDFGRLLSYRSIAGSSGPNAATQYLHDGRVFRHLFDDRGQKLDLHSAARPLRERAESYPRFLKARRPASLDDVLFDRNEPFSVVASDREERLLRAEADWRRSLKVVGNDLLTSRGVREAYWNVRSDASHGVFVRITEGRLRPGETGFRADHRERAVAHAKSLAARTGLRLVMLDDKCTVHDKPNLRFDMADAGAGLLLHEIYDNWDDLAEALGDPGKGAGCRAAAKTLLEAYNAFQERGVGASVPELIDTVSEAVHLMEDDLRDTEGGLLSFVRNTSTVRTWWDDIGRKEIAASPDPDADDAPSDRDPEAPGFG